MSPHPPERLQVRRATFAMAAILGAAAVAAGAFGAHALQTRLSPQMLEIWSTASRYHMWHALALLGLAGAEPLWHGRAAMLACGCWVAGVVLFSGSLYLLSLGGARGLAAVTPLGGASLIAGWIALAVAALRMHGVPSR